MLLQEIFTVRKCLAAAGALSTAAMAGVAVGAPAAGPRQSPAQVRSMWTGPADAMHPAAGADACHVNCEIRVRRMVAGALAYEIDNAGQFPPDPHTFARSIGGDIEELIAPVPGSSPEFQYNTRLAGANRADIRDAAHTVLVYEGGNEHLAFRHGGRAIVAFVDGHVVEVTPRQAAGLRWKP